MTRGTNPGLTPAVTRPPRANASMKVRATKRETQLYREWQASQQRVQMALSTLTGAQQACVNSEVAFKAMAVLKHGPTATFEYANNQLVFVKPKAASD